MQSIPPHSNPSGSNYRAIFFHLLYYADAALRRDAAGLRRAHPCGGWAPGGPGLRRAGARVTGPDIVRGSSPILLALGTASGKSDTWNRHASSFPRQRLTHRHFETMLSACRQDRKISPPAVTATSGDRQRTTRRDSLISARHPSYNQRWPGPLPSEMRRPRRAARSRIWRTIGADARSGQIGSRRKLSATTAAAAQWNARASNPAM